jgi:hypothetical protein
MRLATSADAERVEAGAVVDVLGTEAAGGVGLAGSVLAKLADGKNQTAKRAATTNCLNSFISVSLSLAS